MGNVGSTCEPRWEILRSTGRAKTDARRLSLQARERRRRNMLGAAPDPGRTQAEAVRAFGVGRVSAHNCVTFRL